MLTNSDVKIIEKTVDKAVVIAVNRAVEPVVEGQKRLESALKKEHKLLDEVLVTLDGDIVATQKRVDKIEQHLGIPTVN